MYYLAAFLLSLVIALILIPILRKWAVQLDFVDKPRPDNERKLHREPIPLMAGIALFVGFAVTYILFNGMTPTESAAVLAGSLMILLIGLVDDWYKVSRREFPALPKLIVQLLAALLVYLAGIRFSGFTNPFTDNYVMLPEWLQLVLTLLWIFGVTTVINFTDGLDGLAGSLVTISAGTLFVVAIAEQQGDSAIMAISLVGVGLAYLKYNKPPAKVYMGDSGATFLGFILAIIALDGAFKQATLLSLFVPILALGVPIFDNIFVVLKRMKDGKKIYEADASQIHYRLLSSGLNPKQVLLVLCLISVCLSLSSIILLLLPI
ncbi:glycosyltransferase family 4 protein [Saccharibacillus kuerlensis]|uniref:Undecaprenyl-phosphate alpha-N-acetylglucosaminyl 1-phosphate transferase n=1 Tax=Saccharibacillus kuerlensis TaxID=459527 RepID=A0ABQ2L9R7_9BACL|nr:MraY family glycosyltransferase [Saccharibacillus kuerlensis]GGO07917.1 undecaprenyl-phosphate alpha-N-acetylglucosaminyl 1-phosphate transferase [Saccharibacillus kuerlensis]